MSLRLSAGLPRACSGLMYAAVPRMTPNCVSAGLVIVGDCVTLAVDMLTRHGFGEAKIQHLDGAVRPDLDVGGLQVPVDDSLRMGRVERVGDLPCHRQRLVECERAVREPIGERRPFDQLENQGVDGFRFFEAEDRSDIGVTQRRQHLRFALEASKTIWITRERVRKDLERDAPVQLGIVPPVYLSHSARANQVANFIDAETVAGC